MTICRHWAKLNYCAYGDTCKYEHPKASEEDALEDGSLSAADSRRRAWLRLHESQDNAKKRPVNNGRRGACFARWLLDRFGVDLLRNGRGGSCNRGIVDVAGGKGDLSFELHTLRGLHCTVVDPRPPNYTRLLNRYEPSRRGKSIDCAPALTDVHLHASGIPPEATAETHLIKWGYHVFRATLPVSLPVLFPDTVPEDLRAEVSDTEEPSLLALLRDCTVLIGLHPDQATEPIVDFALRHNKPFAVVPCCVFPNLKKRHLRLPDFCSVLECARLVDTPCCSQPVCDLHRNPQEQPEQRPGHSLEQSEQRLGQSSEQLLGQLVTSELRQQDAHGQEEPQQTHNQPQNGPLPHHECAGPPRPHLVEARSHEQFCAYLAAKDPRIRTEHIDFEGRNTVIFML